MKGSTPLLKVLLWVKCNQISLPATEKLFMKLKSQLMWQTSLLSYFKTLPQPPQPSITTPLSVNSCQHQGKTLHQENNHDSLQTKMMVNIFLAINYLLTKVFQMLFFRHNTIADLINFYSINTTFMCSRRPNMYIIGFFIFTFLLWCGTEPVTFLKYPNISIFYPTM